MVKRIPSGRGDSPSLLSSSALPKMNPCVTGNHPRNSYSLDTHPGTVTQVETRAFATSFLGTGNYPTFRRVSSGIVTLSSSVLLTDFDSSPTGC